MPKTSTERSRECRERKRTQTPLIKKPPKSGAQLVREYRARRKALKAIVAGSSATSKVQSEISKFYFCFKYKFS